MATTPPAGETTGRAPAAPTGQEPLAQTPTVEDLVATVQTLAARIDSLEQELADVRASIPIPEETVLAISAAVAAYLGHKAKLKQIRFRSTDAWTQQGRVAVLGRHVVRGSR